MNIKTCKHIMPKPPELDTLPPGNYIYTCPICGADRVFNVPEKES